MCKSRSRRQEEKEEINKNKKKSKKKKKKKEKNSRTVVVVAVVVLVVVAVAFVWGACFFPVLEAQVRLWENQSQKFVMAGHDIAVNAVAGGAMLCLYCAVGLYTCHGAFDMMGLLPGRLLLKFR